MDLIGLGIGPTGSITYLLTGGLNIGEVTVDVPGNVTVSDAAAYVVLLSDALAYTVTLTDTLIGSVTIGDKDHE